MDLKIKSHMIDFFPGEFACWLEYGTDEREFFSFFSQEDFRVFWCYRVLGMLETIGGTGKVAS